MSQNVAYADYPDAEDEYINDFAAIIDDDIEQSLRTKLKDAEYYNGVEISVATIKNLRTYGTNASSWEAFATGLFNHWGIGNLPENKGVLLLISVEDRKIRIELGAGYPEHYNAVVKSIIENDIAPSLKSGNYTSGIAKGVDAIVEVTTDEVSYLGWYKWYILGTIGLLVSMLIASTSRYKNNPGPVLMAMGLAGSMVLFFVSYACSSDSSDGFGGGFSDGGGASGDF